MISLQKKCLNIVFDDFDKYHSAYVSATTFSDKLKFEFLQRKYSFNLAEKLHKEENFHQKYVDFVLNRFLKSLYTSWLGECDWEVIFKKFSEIGPGLEMVHFDSDHPWEEVICHLCNLQFVAFDYCNNLYLDSIATFCPKIKTIEISYLNISSPQSLKLLCCQADGTFACPELRKIIIRHCSETEMEDIAYLFQKLPMLENFDCDLLPYVLYSIHKDDMETLNYIMPYNLTKLNLTSFVCHSFDLDILTVCVTVCPNIKSFSCCFLSAEHLNLCSKFPKLQELVLEYPYFCDGELNIDNFLVLKGTMLTSLNLTNVSFLTTTLLTNCTHLEVLKLTHVHFCYHENDNFPVPVGHTLKELHMENHNVFGSKCVKEVAYFLSTFPCLEELQLQFKENSILYYPEIQFAILKCCEAGTLEHVNFNCLQLNIQFFRDFLFTCTSLKTLSINSSAHWNYYVNYEPVKRLKDIAKTLKNQPVISFHQPSDSDSDLEYYIRTSDIVDYDSDSG